MYTKAIHIHILYTAVLDEQMVCIGKRKREVLTLDAKQAIVERLQKGEKPSLLMKEFNCGKATISDIKRNKERILAFISMMETSSGAKRRKSL